jgi:hypothetical protein
MKNLTVKRTMFPYCYIHKFSYAYRDGRTHIQIDDIIVDRRRHSSLLDAHSFRAAGYDTDHFLMVAKDRERLAVSKQKRTSFTWRRSITRN